LLKSPIVLGKTLGNNNFCNVKEYHDTILKELKPIMIDSVYRNGRTAVEIRNGVRKLLESSSENTKPLEKKSILKFGRQNVTYNQSSDQDFSYPFKQDNFACCIF